jgi:ligand-binding SRPBCC domain-containing protein
MRTFELRSEIVVPGELDDVFAFFSDAGNLDLLTPEWLRFRILTPLPLRMGPGVEIDYRLSLRGWPIGWRSRITVWDPPHLFVDEQVRGPYRDWNHQHWFAPSRDGTLVTDRVEYSVWGGALVDRLLVAPDLDRIFEFRRSRLVELFQSRDRRREAV